jgi:hypothetical protein
MAMMRQGPGGGPKDERPYAQGIREPGAPRQRSVPLEVQAGATPTRTELNLKRPEAGCNRSSPAAAHSFHTRRDCLD